VVARTLLHSQTERERKKKQNLFFFFFFHHLNLFSLLSLSLSLLSQAEDGYAGVNVRLTPTRTEIVIRATRTKSVLGEKGQRIRELTGLVAKRWNFAPNTLELYAERVANRGLSAIAQAESLKYKLLGGLAVRRACYGIVKFVMESGAKGVEVVVAGKLRGQRAKAMKFREGYMVKSGNSAREYNDYATRHIMMRQGIMGCRVKIMLPHDPEGKTGVKAKLADHVEILQPKE